MRRFTPLLAAPFALAALSSIARADLGERDMVAPATLEARAHVVDDEWIELVLPDLAYDATHVDEASRYTVESADDASFSSGVTPTMVQHRNWPEQGWYDDPATSGGNVAKIHVFYRVFLKLPKKLSAEKSYSVAVDAAAIPGGKTIALSFDDAPNDALHVNQVAYPLDGPKVAYLSAWTGEGSVDFSAAKSFEVVDATSGAVAFTGSVHLDASAASERWSKSNVYSLDFGALGKEGRYRIRVAGVGASYPFYVEKSAFDRIGYTVLRGITMTRDGAVALDSSVTHWSRPSAHMDDAIDEASGAHVDLVGGHMDAGDRGKYPYHSADVSAVLVATSLLFPDRIEKVGESLQLAESKNGIPDVLDEAAYELDWLTKAVMNTEGGGALPFCLRPQNADGSSGFEQGAPLAGKLNRKFYDKTMGPNRSETLYAAGALAMASNAPLFRKYMPAKCDTYRAAALKAFAAYEAHASDASYWKDDTTWYDQIDTGPHKWSDEMVVAASALLEATGDAKYRDALLKELPADLTKLRQWGWRSDGPWTMAFVSLMTSKSALLDASIKARAKSALISWADQTLGGASPYEAPFGVPMPPDVYGRVGWYFSGSQVAFPMMLAYGASGDVKYRDVLVRSWSYLLGANPLSRSYYTGLGDPQRSPRWMTHEIAQVQFVAHDKDATKGWSEPPPGLPSADLQQGNWEWFLDSAWNKARKDAKFPDAATYPALYRYHDGWTTTDEFTIDVLTRGAVSTIALMEGAPPTGGTPSSDAGPTPTDAAGVPIADDAGTTPSPTSDGGLGIDGAPLGDASSDVHGGCGCETKAHGDARGGARVAMLVASVLAARVRRRPRKGALQVRGEA